MGIHDVVHPKCNPGGRRTAEVASATIHRPRRDGVDRRHGTCSGRRTALCGRDLEDRPRKLSLGPQGRPEDLPAPGRSDAIPPVLVAGRLRTLASSPTSGSPKVLVRRPGFVACGAVSLVDIIRLAGFLTLVVREALKSNNLFAMDIWEALTIPFRIRGPVTGRTIYSGPYFSTTAFGASTAVAVAWILLAAGRRWRPEPHWLDRTGRVLGWFWVAMIPLSCWWDYNVLY